MSLSLGALGLAALLAAVVGASAIGSPATDQTARAFAAAPRCSSDPGRQGSPYGTLTVCPASAPIGATVTVTSSSLCGAARGSNPPHILDLTAMFLGPTDYVGTGGGGAMLPFKLTGHGFVMHVRIPATYLGGGNTSNPWLATKPGGGYAFTTYPAAGCYVRFRVTGRQASLAGVWKTPALPGLYCGLLAHPAGDILCETSAINPPHPAGEFGIEMTADGPARIRYSGDWPFSATPQHARTLRPGQLWGRVGVTCKLARSRVTCWNPYHGFTITRHGYRRS